MAIRSVYNGGSHNVMEGRERSCLFHWEQSLHKYTKKFVPVDKQGEHIDICEAWRHAKSAKMAALRSTSIKNWWCTNISNDNIEPLERWLKWWEQRIAHWGGTELYVSVHV